MSREKNNFQNIKNAGSRPRVILGGAYLSEACSQGGEKTFSAQMREDTISRQEAKELYSLPRKPAPKRLKRYLRYHYLRMMRLPGTAYSIALPMAFGISIMFFPTFGFRAAITLLFAYLAGVNKTAGVIASILVTPLAPLCYALDILVGGFLTRGDLDVKTIATQTDSAMQTVEGGIISLQNITDLGINFLFACMLLSAISFIILYTLFFFLIRSYQKKKTKEYHPKMS